MMKELDFLPARFHEARQRRRLTRRNVLYSIGLAVALGSLHAINASHIRSAQAALTDLHAGDGLRNLQRHQLQVLQARKQALEGHLELVSRLEDDAPLDAILAEIVSQMNDSIALRSVRVETTPPAEIDPKDRDPLLDRGPMQVVLGGVAVDDMQVGILLGRLGKSPLFRDAKLTYSREMEEEGHRIREFELVFAVQRVAIPKEEGT